MRKIYFRLLVLAFAFVLFANENLQAGPAQIIIVNINAPGVGFNDPTPAVPVRGNPGTTLGQQRLNAFQYAVTLWAARLDSNVPIRIRAQFTPLAANVLGSAGPISVVRDFANAPLPGTWYHVALANKLAGVDLLPTTDDINANFSTAFNFYLGLDNNHGAQVDLVAVLLHEFAHGLGFSQNASLNTGALLAGFPDAYNTKLFDTSVGLYWPQMTNAQRVASATRFGRVVWDGAYVTAGVPNVLSFGNPVVQVNSPVAIAGPFQFGTAAFGPLVGNPNVSANIIAAVDPADVAGPATTDGCSPFTNAAAVAGKIALIERGTCGFAVKARNATNANAVAVIIYNNAANVNGAPPGMADDGINGIFVTIPTVSIRRADGLAILAELGPVAGFIGVDPNVRAGADSSNRARVYAPFPVVGGSSISHFDTVASRNLLMEPAINGDLTHRVKAPDDLTFELLRDIGWTYPDADNDGYADDEDCNPNSNMSPTLIVGGKDTGVPNKLLVGGCTIADRIAQIVASSPNKAAYIVALSQFADSLVSQGIITATQRNAIIAAATRGTFP
jgi:PA domain